MNDASDVGQGRKHNDATEKYDSEAGKYVDAIVSTPTEDRLPTSQLPKGTDPTPFTLGPMAPGGR